MAIDHKFLDELEELEQNQTFCGAPVAKSSRLLIVGTFNPSNEGVEGDKAYSLWKIIAREREMWDLANQKFHAVN